LLSNIQSLDFADIFVNVVLQAKSMNPAGLERACGGPIGAAADGGPGLVNGL